MTAEERQTRRLGAGRQAEVFGWHNDTVVKLFWPATPRSAVEQEARLTGLAGERGLPTCRVDDIIELDGRTGIVYNRLEGPSLQRVLVGSPRRGGSMARLFGDLHARIHAHEATEGMASQRELWRWKIKLAPDITEHTRALAWRTLSDLPAGNALCHGDFQPYNVLLADSGPVIIDWSAANAGHPLADVARTLALLRHGTPLEGELNRLMRVGRLIFAKMYLREYRENAQPSTWQPSAWELPALVTLLGDLEAQERPPILRRIDRLVARSSPEPR